MNQNLEAAPLDVLVGVAMPFRGDLHFGEAKRTVEGWKTESGKTLPEQPTAWAPLQHSAKR